ncbi:MAG: DUF4037 domain-containing protein [Anaerolineae bacterium]|nr:DUF4037 domain-containing protein [Anaerolineae bacterium]
MTEIPFIKGVDLSQIFYEEAVKPILGKHLPGLSHSAALIGAGSEVLGFDTAQSRDHDWGPRVMLFLTEDDHARHHEQIDQILSQELPAEIRGYPTTFEYHEDGLIHHRVVIFTVRDFFESVLTFDPTGDIRAADWLSIPEYRLGMLTAGRVFHDGLGELEPLRAKLHYYPHDVWLYMLAAQWQRIAQEEPFMGRCGQVDDELGSRVVAARLVHDIMRLCFLMERTYTPYIKWFGIAFAQLDCAETLLPVLLRVLSANSWQEREKRLSTAYEFVAGMHNDLGITDPLSTKVSQFYLRPFFVIKAERFVNAIRTAITSEEVRVLPEHLGAVNQFVDSTDALNDPTWSKEVYK